MKIRPYEDGDQRLFQQLVYQAQERDCQLDNWMASAQRMLGDYLTGLFDDLDRQQGVILVAVDDVEDDARVNELGASVSNILGFVAVLGACSEHDVDEIEHAFGFVTDLVVTDGADYSGVSQALLKAAQQHARKCGSEVLRGSALVRNADLMEQYRQHGFRERVMQFEVTIQDSDS